MRRSPITLSATIVVTVLAAATPLLGACSSSSADPAPAVEATAPTMTVPTASTSAETPSVTDGPPATTVPDRAVPKSGPQPTVVGGAPAPTADPNAPVQVGPIDPGMTRSGEVVVTSIVMGSSNDPIKP